MDTTQYLENEHGRFRLRIQHSGSDNGWLWSVCVHIPPGGWKQLAQGFSYLPDVAEYNGLAALKALAETGVRA